MRNHTLTSEASAELLLNILHPELKDQWVVRSKGTFYRNYNADLLSVDKETCEVKLSRDGYLKLLPQGLLALDEELKNGEFAEHHESVLRRRQVMQEAFVPFDTFAFRRRLRIEEKVSQLLNSKVDYLLRTFFHYDRKSETNPYVRKLAVTLPYIHTLRANFPFLRSLLQSVVGCEVEMVKGRYGDEDDTRDWLPWLRYHLLIDGLSTEQYKELTPDVEGLEQFVQEWFIPFNMKCTIRIKHRPQPEKLNQSLTLEYNSRLSESSENSKSSENSDPSEHSENSDYSEHSDPSKNS